MPVCVCREIEYYFHGDWFFCAVLQLFLCNHYMWICCSVMSVSQWELCIVVATQTRAVVALPGGQVSVKLHVSATQHTGMPYPACHINCLCPLYRKPTVSPQWSKCIICDHYQKLLVVADRRFQGSFWACSQFFSHAFSGFWVLLRLPDWNWRCNFYHPTTSKCGRWQSRKTEYKLYNKFMDCHDNQCLFRKYKESWWHHNPAPTLMIVMA